MKRSTDRQRLSKLNEHYRLMNRLCRMTAELAKVKGEQLVFQRIVDIPTRLLNIESVYLALVDKFDEQLFCVASAPRKGRRRSRPTLQLESMPEARAAIEKCRTIVRQPRRVTGSGRRAPGQPADRAVAYLPLISGGRVFALLVLSGRPGRVISKPALELAAHLTGFAAVAIENSRLLAHLSVAERRFRGLVENIPAMVYSAEPDPPYRTLYIGPQVETILGYTPEECMNHEGIFMTFVHPDDLDMVNDLTRAARKGGVVVIEYRVFDKRGQVRWLRDEAVLVTDPHGKPVALHGVAVDITGSKLLDKTRPIVTVDRETRPTPDL